MRTYQKRLSCLLLISCLGFAPNTSGASDLQITVSSQVPAGGFAFSPVWFGVHNGTFDRFNPGAAANSAVEAVAELANTAPVTAAFSGQGPQTTLGPGSPYLPGATASTTLHVPTPATTQYLSYLAMVVPSNDLFFGNGDPMAIQLFDGSGTFIGPTTINIFGSNVWDAGTEVNDVSNGPAFIQGQDATAGATQGGTISLFLDDPASAAYLASILGQTTAPGYELTQLISAQGLIATITIQEVPEPGTWVLASIGFLAAVFVARRSGRRATT